MLNHRVSMATLLLSGRGLQSVIRRRKAKPAFNYRISQCLHSSSLHEWAETVLRDASESVVIYQTAFSHDS